MTSGIYMIKNSETGQKYIGLSKNIELRFKQHKRGLDAPKSRIDNAILKYGVDNFEFIIIEKINYNDQNELYSLMQNREKYWINFYDTYKNKNHYNLTPGGDFNPMLIPEIAKKSRNNRMGFKHSKETKRKISQIKKQNYKKENHPMYGKHHSLESRKKISLAKQGVNHPNYGKHLSQETKDKISKGNLNKTISKETREKISKSRKGKSLSPKTKQKLSKIFSGYNNPQCKWYIIDEKGGLDYIKQCKKDGKTKQETANLLGVGIASLHSYLKYYNTLWSDLNGL